MTVLMPRCCSIGCISPLKNLSNAGGNIVGSSSRCLNVAGIPPSGGGGVHDEYIRLMGAL
jgi:hypothetical protein